MENKSYVGRPKPGGGGMQGGSIGSVNTSSTEDIFRKSGGFSKMRASGTSFRPSSRDGRPQSSQTASSTLYTLTYTSNFDELSLASSIKMDMLQLQDEIDNLDMDGKLRSGNLEFGSAPNSAMRKWLAKYSKIGKKDIEKRVNANLETQKLLEVLSVPNAEQGLQKLFKITSIFDLLVNKITEYEIIHLLRYDEVYNTLKMNQSSTSQGKGNNKLNMLAQGVDIKKFLPAQANIERLVEMYGIAAKSAQQDQMSKTGGFSSIGQIPKLDGNGIESRKDMIRYLDRLPGKNMDQQFKEKLLQFLNEANEIEEKLKVTNAFVQSQKESNENNKRNSTSSGPNFEAQVRQLQAQMREIEEDKNNVFQRVQTQINVIENLKKQLADSELKVGNLNQQLELGGGQSNNNNAQQQQKQDNSSSASYSSTKPPQHKDDPDYWVKLIDETKQLYEQRQMGIKDENDALKDKMVLKNVKIEQLQSQVSEAFQREQDFKAWKTEYFREFQKNFKDAQGYQDGYERALLTEFDRYKKAWERKIDDLNFELESAKKSNARTILDLKAKCKREEESKALMLRKLGCYIKY